LTVTTENVTASEIEVWWRSEYLTERVVYGRWAEAIPNSYGPNSFVVRLHGRAICQWSHFKSAAWHVHDYEIHVVWGEEAPLCRIVARGADP
jgi:hypothetical protein